MRRFLSVEQQLRALDLLEVDMVASLLVWVQKDSCSQRSELLET